MKTHDLDYSAAWPVFGHLIGVLGQFGLYKMVAQFWGADIFGKFALVLAIVVAVNMLFFGPFTQWSIRDYQGAKENQQLHEFFHTVRKNSILASLVLIVLAIISSFLLDSHLAISTTIGAGLIILGTILGIGVAINNMIFSVLNVAKFPELSASLTAIDSISKLLAVIVIWIAGYRTLNSVVVALLFTQILMMGIGYLYIKSRIAQANLWNTDVNVAIVGKYHSDMLHYAWPFLIWGIFGYLASMGDRWVVASHVSAFELGVYSAMVLASIGLSNAITTAINKGVVPVVFRVAGSGLLVERKNQASKLVTSITIGLVVLFLLLITLSFYFPEYIIALLASSEFTTHKDLFWLLMLAAAALNIAQFLITHGLINKSPAIYLPSKIIHGAIIVLGLVMAVPTFGLKGAVYVLLVGNVLQLIMVYFVNKRLATGNRFKE